jgi:ABC-type multidrug transport system ATPase subunit
MKIIATDVEKKFRKEWIFKKLHGTYSSGKSYALVGPNGTGKSTLLKILAQFSLPTHGKVEFFQTDGTIIPTDRAHQYIAFAAPYVDVIEEYTLNELIVFLQNLGFISADLDLLSFEKYMELSPGKTKLIKNYSSGMRQKIKLACALLSPRPILCLDEPTSNLDEQAKQWFIAKLAENRSKMIFIASNEALEIGLCDHQIAIADFKN